MRDSERQMPVQLLALEEVVAACDRLAGMVRESGFAPQTVVAIARGGFTPARFLYDFLGVSSLAAIRVRHYEAGARCRGTAEVVLPLSADVRGQRVLVVDDVNDSGDTLAAAFPHLRQFSPAEVRTAVLHEKSSTTCPADFVAERISQWRWLLYPWAVVEDAGGFLRGMPTLPRSREEAARSLESRYGLRLDAVLLDRVIRFNDLEVGH